MAQVDFGGFEPSVDLDHNRDHQAGYERHQSQHRRILLQNRARAFFPTLAKGGGRGGALRYQLQGRKRSEE